MATYVTLPLLKEMATTRDQLYWSKALPLSLRFNDGEIKISTSSFLFKNSKLLQSFDIEEDNEIPIICLRSYVIDENNACLFDDKTDLSFMFTLQPNKFLEVCKFLDIICYENKDTLYSKEYIKYVMTNIKEEINIIKYFMQPEIRSILNYLNNEDINIQIKSCTPTFYALYLSKYKEEVIKHNRIDIFEVMLNKHEYYRYMHNYDNHLTQYEKETQQYKDYIVNINNNLLSECKANSFNNMIKIIEQNLNVNFQDNDGHTILYYVLRYNKGIEIIKYLVKIGANINLQDNYGNTALHIALHFNNNLEVIKYLVENGANVNLQNNYGNSVLHEAMQTQKFEIMKYLVKNGANVNLQNNRGNTALYYPCCYYDNIEAFNYLIQNNANVNIQDNYGNTLLHFSFFYNKKISKYLIENGANINLQNNNGNTTLHVALLNHNLEIIPFLIKNGANINLQNNNGNTVLHYTMQIQNLEIIQYLIKNGANVNLQNNNGKTALHYASNIKNNFKIIHYLILNGVNINLQDNSRKSALDIALQYKNNDKVINYLRSIM